MNTFPDSLVHLPSQQMTFLFQEENHFLQLEDQGLLNTANMEVCNIIQISKENNKLGVAALLFELRA